MRRCVWFRNLKNEEAMARVGPQRHKKKVFGDNTLVFGDNTLIFGDNTLVFGDNNLVFGDNTLIFGDNTLSLPILHVMHFLQCGILRTCWRDE